ncbi:MAG: glycerol kinase GlpK [Clostridia bacterium]|nr:glycerol kinase GlpK [Clostridia bacterium]
MKKYILTLDEGTTSARAILFDKNCRAVSVAQHEFGQIYPKPSFVEHDPEEIFKAQYTSIKEAISAAGALPSEIAAAGITNQRETTVVWDKSTGKPVYNAIVWQCRRTADMCEQIKAAGYEKYISDTTGLKIDAYFSATKIKWILDNVDGARTKAQNGELLFGTVDTYLLWKLSAGKIFATDTTNASRTMLFNIHTLSWDEKLLEIFDIPRLMLPKVRPSGSNFGDIEIEGVKIPVCGIAGDQQAALFGQHCFGAGDIKNTYGTGCFLLMNTGNKAIKSKNGLVTTVAATLENEKPQYALEGSVFIGGAVIQWVRDELQLISNAAESEEAAKKVKDSGGVYVVPAFSGLGTPYWDMYARGTICGITRGTNRNHIVRACLESIAYQTNDLINAMKEDFGGEIGEIKVDGGASRNNFLMQFQSDISNIRVTRPQNAEATALGAALLAGLTCKFFNSREELLTLEDGADEFTPHTEKKERELLLSGWKQAIKSTITFHTEV